jgi:hypothetical protein
MNKNLYTAAGVNDDPPKPKNVKISLDAFLILNGLVKATGMKQWVVVDRLLKWLGAQPDVVKNEFVIPGGDPAGKLIELRDDERATAGEAPPVTFEQAIRQIRSLADQLATMERAYRPILEQAVKEAAAKKGTSKK